MIFLPGLLGGEFSRVPVELSQPYAFFSWILIGRVKSHSHKGGPDHVPSRWDSQDGPGKRPETTLEAGLRHLPGAPKCDVLLRPRLIVPGAAKPRADWAPPPTPCTSSTPFPPSSQIQQGRCSHLRAACRLSLWCPYSMAFLEQSSFDLMGLCSPLFDWQQSDAASDTSQG